MNKIQLICREIEKQFDVKILFCVESGSRSWGLESKDSDYDLRFVYYRKPKDYITIKTKPETISKEITTGTPEVYDVMGMDIIKYTKLLMSSNPTAIEWLLCEIVYWGQKPEVFVNFAKTQFKPISLYYHYKSMCRKNYLKYLATGSMLNHKKYLYAMRGLINAKWVAQNKKLPPINFLETIAQVKGVPKEVTNLLLEIIDVKKLGKEKDEILSLPVIDDYIEKCLADDSDRPGNVKGQSIARELDETMKEVIFNETNIPKRQSNDSQKSDS